MHVTVTAQAHLRLPGPDHPSTDQAAGPARDDLLDNAAHLIDDEGHGVSVASTGAAGVIFR